MSTRLPRHPAPDFVEAEILNSDDDPTLYQNERDFASFAQDATSSESQPDITVWVLDVDPKTGKPKSSAEAAFLFDTGLDSYKSYSELLSFIRDEYGGGVYRISGRMRREGKDKVGFHKVVRIVEPKPKMAPAGQHTGAPSELTTILQTMMKVQEDANRRIDMLSERLTRQPAAAPNFFANLDMEKVAALAAGVGTLMSAMKGMFGGGSDLASQITALKGLKDLAGDFGGGGGEEDVMQTLIKNMGGPLAQIAATKMLQGPATPPTAQVMQPVPARRPQPVQPPVTETLPSMATTPASHPNPEDIPAANPQVEHLRQIKAVLTPHIQQLAMAAQFNLPVEAIAAKVVEEATDEQFQSIMQLVEQDDCIDVMASWFPDVSKYRDWFEKFRVELLDCAELEDADVDKSQSQADTPVNAPPVEPET